MLSKALHTLLIEKSHFQNSTQSVFSILLKYVIIIIIYNTFRGASGFIHICKMNGKDVGLRDGQTEE